MRELLLNRRRLCLLSALLAVLLQTKTGGHEMFPVDDKSAPKSSQVTAKMEYASPIEGSDRPMIPQDAIARETWHEMHSLPPPALLHDALPDLLARVRALRTRKGKRQTSTLSHLQLPQGLCSTTSQRTLRARHDTQALAARRLVFFCESAPLAAPAADVVESDLFLPTGFPLSPAGFFAMSVIVVFVVVGEEEEGGAAFCDCDCDSGGGEPATDVSEASDMMSD